MEMKGFVLEIYWTESVCKCAVLCSSIMLPSFCIALWEFFGNKCLRLSLKMAVTLIGALTTEQGTNPLNQ